MSNEKENDVRADELDDYWMTGADLKRYLSISESYYRTLLDNDAVPYKKLGRNYRFKKSAIDKWMDENPGVGGD